MCYIYFYFIRDITFKINIQTSRISDLIFIIIFFFFFFFFFFFIIYRKKSYIIFNNLNKFLNLFIIKNLLFIKYIFYLKVFGKQLINTINIESLNILKQSLLCLSLFKIGQSLHMQ